MNSAAWLRTVHEVAKRQIQLKRWAHAHILWVCRPAWDTEQGARQKRAAQAAAAGAKSKPLTKLLSTPAPCSLQVYPQPSVGPGLDSE